MPPRAAPGPRADVGLLDAPSVDVNLGKRTSVSILAEWPHHHFARHQERMQSALRGASARFVQLGRIDVRQPNLPAVADQRVAVDGDATLTGENYG